MFVNIDINTVVHPFLNRICEQEHFSNEMLFPFVDQYADTKVTDLLFNVFCQYSATDSEILGTYEEKYQQSSEMGIPVDYTANFHCLHQMNRVKSCDPFEVWINRCRETGIRPWLSVRMNDAHNNCDQPYFARTSFFYEAKKNGWLVGDGYGYYSGNFDYGVKEIRDRMLGYIKEQLHRYDVDGIELDFLREIICFKYHTADIKECILTMDGFIADVKRIIVEEEKAKGHKILLAVRCMRDYEQSLRYGFDPTHWNADILVPSPRWASSDSGIKVEEWKRLCPNSRIIPCIETLLAVEPDHTGIMSAEVAKGHIASFLSQGADDFYLYNYFSDPDAPYADGASPKGHPYHRNHRLYSSPHAYPKRFAIVGQSSEHYPDTFPTWRPLPCRNGEFDLVTGDISGRQAWLIVGVDGDINGTEVTFNGEVCKDFSVVDLTYLDGIGAQPDGYVNNDTICYRCTVKPRDKVQHISIQGEVSTVWIEIVVI